MQFYISLSLSLLVASACSTVDQLPLNTAEQPAQNFQSLQSLHFKKTSGQVLIAPSVTPYLTSLAHLLAKTDPALRALTIQVFILKKNLNQEAHHLWVTPSGYLYLPKHFLSLLKTESQIEALLSLCLGSLSYLLQSFSLDSTRLYAVLQKNPFLILSKSTQLLYAHHIDPRSLLEMLKIYGQYASTPSSLLQYYLEQTRYAIVTFPPLKTPKKDSEDFFKIHNKIQHW